MSPRVPRPQRMPEAPLLDPEPAPQPEPEPGDTAEHNPERGDTDGTEAIIALGSNLGNRVALLADALRRLNAVHGVRVVDVSPLVETPALKVHGIDDDAPRYLNAVVAVRTSLAPHALLDTLQAIESELGRVRLERWGDRTVDLDIIDFGGQISSDERLTIPHPRAEIRAFVLAPWASIRPEAQIAGRGSVSNLLRQADDPVWPYAGTEGSAWHATVPARTPGERAAGGAA